MNLEEFKKEFERIDNKQRVNDEQQKNFFEYMNLLLQEEYSPARNKRRLLAHYNR